MSLDTHVHLWNRTTDPQPWIDPATMAAIDRDFGPDDLESMLDATGMAGAVVVQSSNSAAETHRLLAHSSPRIAGVVGWVDLTVDPRPELDAMAAGRLVGIRHLVHLDPDREWLARPEVGAALDRLAGRGLGFDLVVRAEQLPLVATVVRAHPEVRFVVDHLGGLAEAADAERWARDLRAVAALPNTWAKLSGLPGDPRDAVDVALEAFGPDRLMYGSDWPVVDLRAGATAWRATVDSLIGALSPDERDAVLTGTGTAFYRAGA